MKSNSSLFHSSFRGSTAKPALLAGLGPSAQVAALAAALPVAADREVETVGTALVEALGVEGGGWGKGLPRSVGVWVEWLEARVGKRERISAWEAGIAVLVREWGRLPCELRRAALARVGTSGLTVAARLAGGDSARVRESLIRFAAESGGMLDLVCDGILDDDAAVGSAAEESLIRIAEAMSGQGVGELGVKVGFETATRGRVEWSEEDVARFRERIAQLCAAYSEHRRRGVLAAAVAMASPGAIAFGDGKLGTWFVEENQASHPSLRTMVRRGTGAMSRRRAWEWVTKSSVAGAAEDRLGRAESADEFGAVLEASHLMENPKRRAKAAQIEARRRGSLVPPAEVVAELSVGARRGIGRLVEGRSGDEVERLMAPFLTDEDDAARLGAVRALPGAGTLDYCFDRSEDVAAAAVVKWWYALSASGHERRRVAANLARSPHPRVRWMGQRFMESGARVGTREKAEQVRDVNELRTLIRTGSAEEKLDGISTARRLGMQRQVELELLGVVGVRQAEEERVLGAAVSALGESGTNSALEAVEVCLAHPVARVRANAAEGLVRRSLGKGDLAMQSPRLYDALLEMKSDESHRVRSSVVRAMLRASSPEWGGTGYEPAAADELIRMLEDERPMHRLAGLWAVEHVMASPGESVSRRWDRIASIVARLASEETDDAVQRRAAWCARRMLAMEMGPELQEMRA